MPLVTSRNPPVASLVTTMATPGRTAPCSSVTLPPISAVPCCAKRGRTPPDAVVIVGRSLRRDRPDVVAALGELDGRIPVDRMRALNLAVDGQGRSPSVVARDVLSALGSRGAEAPTRSFVSWSEYEGWRHAQTNPWLR